MIPSGTVTFLFTDIEGSTKLSQEFPESLQSALDIHHSIMQNAIESNNGFVFEIVGDAFCCAFQNAVDAVKAAIAAQLILASEKWKDAVIKVRIGIHSGEAEWNGNRYMGYITLARSARIMSSAYGEQILISNDSYSQLSGFTNDFSFRDLGERRLKDVIQPIRLFQVIADGLREDFPPLKTLDARPNNLPVQLTSFIGRESVMADVKKLLKKNRLLTIIGSGGNGKTRLAMQIGADLIDEFANGVFIVELASVSDPSFTIPVFLNSLGIKEESGKSPGDSLTEFLKDKELLLIMDNCEHIVSECANLAENLLLNCQKLKIIATSRETLKCTGEQIFKLPSLSVPDTTEKISPELLTQYESVRLFIERALSVNHGFRVNYDNASALAEICSRLDGIPLAIELAATRIKILSVEKIQQRLDDRFNLLTGGKRTALPRQQTLKAMINWSYDLLSENEKLLWKRLSVFSGGCDTEAIEKICSDEKLCETEIIDILHNLTEKSIIVYDEEKERFKMLETIRQYGVDLLISENEYETVSDKHMNYYLNLAVMSDSLLSGNEMHKILNKLETERGNFERSMIHALKNPELPNGINIAISLGSFWKIRGHYSEGIRWLEKCLETKINGSNLILGKAYCKLSKLFQLRGNVESAQEKLLKSLEIFREINDEKGIAEALHNLGLIKFEQGNYDSAFRLYEEGLEILKKSDDRKNIAYSLNDLGSLLIEKGEYERAEKIFRECAMLHKETGEKRGLAYSLFNLGSVLMEQGNLKDTTQIFEESISYFREIEEVRGLAYCISSLGTISFHLGDIVRAERLQDESIALFRKTEEKRGLSFSLSSRANIALHKGDFILSSKLLEESLGVSRETGFKPIIAYSLFSLGESYYSQHEYEKAKDVFEESLAISTEIGHKPGIAFNLNCLGNIALQNGDTGAALDLLKKSLNLNKELNQKKELAANLIGFAVAKFKTAEHSDAAVILGFVNKFLEEINLTPGKTDSNRYENLLNDLKNKMGEDEFPKHYDKGKTLSLDKITELAFN